ncbi:hypothetical protein [Enterococcus sp. AZ007]|uniref:hypothetical protein n=1 Tax=Enterococcus sp. AZ007 TaxID=2774839 RepID=UPI003F1E4C38
MKKVCLMLGVSLMLLPLGLGVTVASAAEAEEVPIEEAGTAVEDDVQLEDVVETDATDDGYLDGEINELTPEEPIEVLTRGTRIPTSRHNINKVHYNVGGNGFGGVLYSNKLFYGVKKYKIRLTNKGSKTATVQFKTTKSTAKTLTIKSGKTVSATVGVGSANTNYYLRITGGAYRITGYVSK